MPALLAGAQLASHLLVLTEGSDRLLPEVYPRVPHIGRFNLTSDAARRILDSADTHLGAMSVPYAWPSTSTPRSRERRAAPSPPTASPS